MGCIYLIHFDKPYKHARHYLGYADSDTPDARIERHRKGNGATLMRVITQAGIEWEVARIWLEQTRDFERKLKNGRHVPRLCPICQKEKKDGRLLG
ncbi:MAG: endonuclease [Syntrophobacteraceae bacterium]